MEILAQLRQDHQEIDLYLAALEDTADDSLETRRKVLDLLVTALKTHQRVEEEVVYSRLLEEGLGLRPRILRSYEEHEVIAGILRGLGSLPLDDQAWLPRLGVLGSILKLHIEAEEKLFDEIRERIDRDELLALGERFQKRKEAMNGPSVIRPLRPHGVF